MAKLIYNLFLFLYSTGIRIVSLWNPKAKKWLEGRRNIFATINSRFTTHHSRTVWMHCASLGEFEQGRPVLESLKQQDASLTIVLTFFSPSGYEVMKDYKGADHVFYLPMDNIFSAKKFIDAINPTLVLWVKYEYWFYYLQELKRRNIPVLLVSGVFRKSQPFFKWYGGIWKKMLENFDHLFVQNDASEKLLQTIGVVENVSISGDTRFDRVIEIAKQSLNAEIITSFCAGSTIIVAGSTWEDDEIILAAYGDETNHQQKIIVVPHELDKAHLDNVKKMFKKSVCYTEVESDAALLNAISGYNTLIIDTIGMLSRLYNYGHINYIGGGFTNDGIHNILEAAVWGKPVIIGENYEKYFEAVDLVECAAAESIGDVVELKEVIDNWLTDTIAYNESAAAAKEYVYAKAGATKKIIEYIYIKRLLTN
ncbi:3-deoxy-D-manno-octulosonic acid transferase [Ferruginibacter sp. SUN106]|uniref:3-deoxy-D-manno-octulosonic acid transferase n=1 Tax=Ferruginibacter sp. SUN106 TaxID=2978348 RepID=UPI003D3698AA